VPSSAPKCVSSALRSGRGAADGGAESVSDMDDERIAAEISRCELVGARKDSSSAATTGALRCRARSAAECRLGQRIGSGRRC
jgi:hypothetical protein